MTASVDELRFYAATYADIFSARRDAYSPWTGTSWIARRADLTPDVVLDGFRQRNRPIGAYMIGPDSTTPIAALDIDLDDGLAIGNRIARSIWQAGGRAYLETSKRGAHLWCPLDRPKPAIVVRHALRAFIARAGVEPDPRIELRPGQDRLSGPEGLGHALRMPMMPHRETGQRSPLYAFGRVVARTLAEAIELEPMRAELVDEVGAEYVEPEPPRGPKRDDGLFDNSPARFNATVSVSYVLAFSWGVGNATPGRVIRCPSPGHEDRNPSCHILPDDRRVYCHAPACELNNDGRGRDAYDLAKLAPRGAATFDVVKAAGGESPWGRRSA